LAPQATEEVVVVTGVETTGVETTGVVVVVFSTETTTATFLVHTPLTLEYPAAQTQADPLQTSLIFWQGLATTLTEGVETVLVDEVVVEVVLDEATVEAEPVVEVEAVVAVLHEFLAPG